MIYLILGIIFTILLAISIKLIFDAKEEEEELDAIDNFKEQSKILDRKLEIANRYLSLKSKVNNIKEKLNDD